MKEPRGDYREITQPALLLTFKHFHELQGILHEYEASADKAATAKSTQVGTIVIIVALLGVLIAFAVIFWVRASFARIMGV